MSQMPLHLLFTNNITIVSRDINSFLEDDKPTTSRGSLFT